MSGMSEIAKGRLSHQVPMRVPDELGRLTVALNEMVARIREMICARERLLLDVSHELRSPLTRMKVAVEFLPDASTRERLQDELRELEAMVTELLESERLKSEYGGITPANTDLVELVRDVAQAYDAHAPGVRIIGPTSVIVPLDGRRVRAALRNVLENALKHTAPEAGPVQIRIDTREREARVIVRDHGPGVPPDQRALIFEPFYRVDKSRTRSTGGYGLGLSLVKTIMAAHGGDVRVADAPDHGSEFILTFPCSAIAHGSLTEAVPLVGHGQS
jgi:signal transduction histidine kinase